MRLRKLVFDYNKNARAKPGQKRRYNKAYRPFLRGIVTSIEANRPITGLSVIIGCESMRPIGYFTGYGS